MKYTYKDKDGIEIKTGDIVEITGAYFKNDNGLYYVDNSPGDPSWCGRGYSLKRICKTGKISKAKHNICFWPIGIFVSDRAKGAEARRWNQEHAKIEVKTVENMGEITAYFQEKADAMNEQIQRAEWSFGEDSEIVRQYKELQAHYRAVATVTSEQDNGIEQAEQRKALN